MSGVNSFSLIMATPYVSLCKDVAKICFWINFSIKNDVTCEVFTLLINKKINSDDDDDDDNRNNNNKNNCTCISI